MRRNEQLAHSFELTDYSVVATEDSGQRHYFLMPSAMMEQEEYGEYHVGDTLAFGPAPMAFGAYPVPAPDAAPDENEDIENTANNLINNFNSATNRVLSNGPMSAEERELLDREFERLTS